MKKNVANILFLISILSVGNILNANNQDVSKDVKKPIEIRIDDNGQVRKDQSGPNKNKKNDNSGQNSYVNTNTQRGGTETISNSAGTVKVDASSYNSQGQDYRQKFIILHYTAGNRDSSLKTLTENEVSAHYLVSDDK